MFIYLLMWDIGVHILCIMNIYNICNILYIYIYLIYIYIYIYIYITYFIEDKLIELEDRSRRNNLRVDGIKERPNETWEDCENELHTLFKESLGFEEEVVIERAHPSRQLHVKS